MLVRTEDLCMIHLSEIGTLIVDSLLVSITTSLLIELVKNKVNIIFCDEKHNPLAEVNPYYGAHNTSKKIRQQISWDEYHKRNVWTNIIRQKIINQANVLHKIGAVEAELLYDYAQELLHFDISNREGHAAKVYFNVLFSKGFSRKDDCFVNAALDYGYSIVLSLFNREIIANGYLTQLGIKHINEYNQFNLSSDFMEPFRSVVDYYVYNNVQEQFDSEYKYKLVDLLNMKVIFEEKEYYLSNVIQLYVKKLFKTIESDTLNEMPVFLYP